MIVGSNGKVAWGYTNTEGDWNDVVIVVELDSQDTSSYRTPDGLKKIEKHVEVIKVRDGADEKLEILSTVWGTDHSKRSSRAATCQSLGCL